MLAVMAGIQQMLVLGMIERSGGADNCARDRTTTGERPATAGHS
jgi:hypothetical protein